MAVTPFLEGRYGESTGDHRNFFNGNRFRPRGRGLSDSLRPNHWFAPEGSKSVVCIRSGEVTSHVAVSCYDKVPGDDQTLSGPRQLRKI